MVRSISKAWIVWYAISLHMFWAAMLLTSDTVQWVTAINDMVVLFGGSRSLTAFVLFSFSMLAVLSINLSRKNELASMLLMLPQQALMVIGAFSAIGAIASSAFADGVIRSRMFIAADQFPAVLACIMHTFALIDHYAGFAFRKKS